MLTYSIMLGSLPIPSHAYYIDTAPIRVTLACKKSGLLIMWDRWKPAGSNFMLHFDIIALPCNPAAASALLLVVSSAAALAVIWPAYGACHVILALRH